MDGRDGRGVRQARVWLALACFGGAASAAGCFEAKPEAGAQGDEAQAVAEALTRGMHFAGGATRGGKLPDADRLDITLLPLGGDVVVRPGDSSELTFELDNPDEVDDPVETTLLQFGEAATEHIEVTRPKDAPAEGKGATLRHTFDASTELCSQLCPTRYSLKMQQAVRTRSGKVGHHDETVFVLDCSQSGGTRDGCAPSGEKPGTVHTGTDAGIRTGGGGGTGMTMAEAVCGNGKLEPGESCDGTDLGGELCTSMGFRGGSLFCDPVSCTFDDSMCLQGDGTGGFGGAGF
jgi:hypothetical protein